MNKFKNDNGLWGIKLEEQVTNLVFYKEDYYWGRNPFYHVREALFKLDGLYFEYSYSSSYNGTYASFWQISQEEYERKCMETRSVHPWVDGKYDDGKSSFVLIDQPEGNFSAEVYPKECHNVTHPGILAVLAEIKAAEEAEARQRAEEKAAENP